MLTRRVPFRQTHEKEGKNCPRSRRAPSYLFPKSRVVMRGSGLSAEGRVSSGGRTPGSAGRGSVAASTGREIKPAPIRMAPATKPEVPAVMSAMLADARYRKLIGMPTAPAAMDKPARSLHTPRELPDTIVDSPKGRSKSRQLTRNAPCTLETAHPVPQ